MSSDEQFDAKLKVIARAAAPGPSMADDVMRRIERGNRVLGHAPSPLPEEPLGTPDLQAGRRRRLRLLRWLVPAAAAAVVAGFLFFPSTSSTSVAWADVAERMRRARTMVCEYESHRPTARKETLFTHDRGVLKDPCFSRAESYSTTGSQPPRTDGQPEMIVIAGVGGDPNLSVMWHPQTMSVTHMQRVNCAPEKPTVTSNWNMLRRISADQTSQIGTDRINGEPTAVFGIPVEKFYGAQANPETWRIGTVRVWVSKATLVPVQFEMKYRVQEDGQDGGEVYCRMFNMQWDVPVSDDLFNPPVFDEKWRQTTERTVCYEGKTLTPGATLRVGPPDGPPVISENDVEPLKGSDVLDADGKERGAASVSFQLTKEARERLRAFTAAHVGGTITLTFNGEVLDEFTTEKPVWWQWVTLPISSLGLTLEQFEAKYLVTGGHATRPAPARATTGSSDSQPANEGSKREVAGKPGGCVLAFRIVPNLPEARRRPTISNYGSFLADLKDTGPGITGDKGGDFQWFEVADNLLNVSGRGAPDIVTREGRRYLLLCGHNLIVDGVGHPTVMVAGSKEGPAWGLVRASMAWDRANRPALDFQLDDAGAQLMKRLTAANIGNYMAILVEGKVVGVAAINSEIGANGQINGSFTPKEVNRIVMALRRAYRQKPASQPSSTRPGATAPENLHSRSRE